MSQPFVEGRPGGGAPLMRSKVSPRASMTLVPSLAYCFDTGTEWIVTGDHMGVRSTFLRPKADPLRLLHLRQGSWFVAHPKMWWLADDLFRQAKVVANDR